MRIISRGRTIVEGAAVVALIAGLAFNMFGCSAGGNSPSGSSSTSSGGSTSNSVTNTTSSTSSTPNGACASSYNPNYFSLWVAGESNNQSGVWTHSPIKVYFTNDLTVNTQGGGTTSYQQQVLTGFNEWTALLGSGITYTQVGSASGADVQVTFSSNSGTTNSANWSASASGSNLAFSSMTVTFQASSTGTETPALLQLMGAEAFGSILGLPASNTTTDLTNPHTTATAPSTDDINTVKTLYCSFY